MCKWMMKIEFQERKFKWNGKIVRSSELAMFYEEFIEIKTMEVLKAVLEDRRGKQWKGKD
jgi:hypothetical protein